MSGFSVFCLGEPPTWAMAVPAVLGGTGGGPAGRPVPSGACSVERTRVTSTRLGGMAGSPGGGAPAERLPVAQLVPAGAVELLDALADSAAVLGHSETTLTEALERLIEGPVR